MALTSKAIFYFSLTGNTKALFQQLGNLTEWDIYDLNAMKPGEVSFKGYDTILIGTLTLGRGTPPLYFKKLFPKLLRIRDARIGLFGSGQSHYGNDFYCGALDVLENLLRHRNSIIFKLKFESYPTSPVIEEFKKSVKELLLFNEITKI